MKLVSLSNTSEFLYLTDVNDQQVSAVRVTVPESVSADKTFDEFNSSWPTSDGDTAELHMYYENFNNHMRNRPNGMSEATTIVVDTEGDSDYDDDTNYDNDHENIEEPMYLYIANSVFAFSLFKDTVWNFCAECTSNDNPSCHICRKENES